MVLMVLENKLPRALLNQSNDIMSHPSDISIKITDRNGNKHLVKSPIDMALNLMEVIRMHELAPEGSIGVCGGMAMCASCQCYIISSHKLPEKTDEEDAMLSEAFNVNTNSRLGCQIHINSNKMDGLEVVIAPEE